MKRISFYIILLLLLPYASCKEKKVKEDPIDYRIPDYEADSIEQKEFWDDIYTIKDAINITDSLLEYSSDQNSFHALKVIRRALESCCDYIEEDYYYYYEP